MIKTMFIIFVFMLGMSGSAFAEKDTNKEIVPPAALSASAAAPAPANTDSGLWFHLILTVVCVSSMMGFIGYVLEAQLGKK